MFGPHAKLKHISPTQTCSNWNFPTQTCSQYTFPTQTPFVTEPSPRDPHANVALQLDPRKMVLWGGPSPRKFRTSRGSVRQGCYNWGRSVVLMVLFLILKISVYISMSCWLEFVVKNSCICETANDFIIIVEVQFLFQFVVRKVVLTSVISSNDRNR